MFDRRSVLARQLAAGGRDGLDARRALTLSEPRGWSLAQLAIFSGHEAAVAAALRPVLGAEPLPTLPATVAYADRARLYRTAADAWWIVTAEPTLVSTLARSVPGTSGTVTDLSHSRVRIAVEGPAARAMLGRGICVDLHPLAFAIGQFAQTGLHHTAVLLERSAEARYELYLPRTFAVSIWEWLIDAALPFGYEIVVGPDLTA